MWDKKKSLLLGGLGVRKIVRVLLRAMRAGEKRIAPLSLFQRREIF